jgi:DHA1 family inner membrane transport protein
MPASRSALNPPACSPGLVIFALAIGAFAIGTTEFATMSLLPYFAKDLGIDAPTAGHVISAYALGVVVGAPVLTVMAARMARRTLLLWLMAMFAVFNGLCAFAPSYEWMLVLRFLSGLPHGAYFGIASLVAVSLVPLNKRNQAVGRMFLGLTVATIIGVPFANWLGHAIGWRWGFGLVAFSGALTVVLVAMLAPRTPPQPGSSPLRELGALKHAQVWLTLGVGAIGFGGLFCVYTYLADTLMQVTQASPATVPVVLGVFGVGMTVGNIIIPWLADRALLPTAGGLLLWSAAASLLFMATAGNICARHGAADPVDGCRQGCPGAGGGTQPFRFQLRQCAWPVAGRHGHCQGLWLDIHGLGRKPAGPGRVCIAAGFGGPRPVQGRAAARQGLTAGLRQRAGDSFSGLAQARLFAAARCAARRS